jgi:hypothetical protein
MSIPRSHLISAAIVALSAIPAWASDYRIEATLTHADSQPAVIRCDVSSAQASGLERSPKKVAALVRRLKSDFADKHGYSKRVFGEKNWRMMTGVRVDVITLVTPFGRRDIRAREVEDDSYFDDQAVEPPAPEDASGPEE